MKKILFIFAFAALAGCSSDSNSAPIPGKHGDGTKDGQAVSEEAPISATEPNIFENFTGPQGKVSINIFMEEGMWIVEQSVIAEDGLPDPVGRWAFTTKEKAFDYAKNNLNITEEQKNPAALDQPIPEELPGINTLVPKQALWEVDPNLEWNWEWEVKYAEWTRANLHPDFFQAVGIENDCQDAAVQARAIFSRLNKLPLALRLAGGGAWFTHKTLRPAWKNLKTNEDWKEDKRFLAALDYLANTTYTHTLGRDSYPVAISKEALIEGTVFLYLDQTSGHTLIVNEINLNNTDPEAVGRLPMYTLNSTVPKGVQPLTEYMFSDSSQPVKSEFGNTGFVRFRWPTKNNSALVDAKDMPHYSEEQYDPELMAVEGDEEKDPDDVQTKNFSIFVFKRLNPEYDPVLRMTEGIKQLGEMLEFRKDVVEQGYSVCSKSTCVEPDANYEAWSTPSRDKRIKALIHDLEEYRSVMYAEKKIGEVWEEALANPIIDIDGNEYLLKHVKWTWENSLFSFDPNDTPAVRWGLSPEVFAQSSFDVINPVLVARKAKIDSSSCTPSTCALFSPEFMVQSSFMEDAEITATIGMRSQYCQIAGATNCAKFEGALSGFPTQVPQHSNFLQTWNNTATLNSDPRVAADVRWGQLANMTNSVSLMGTWNVIGVTDTGLVVVRSYQQETLATIQVIDMATKQPLYTKSYSGGYSTYTTVGPKTGLMAIYKDGSKEIQIVDVASGEMVQAVTMSELDVENGYYSGAKWVNENLLTLNFSDSIVFLRKGDNGFVPEYFKGYQEDEQKNILTRVTGTILSVVILEGETPTVKEYDISASIKKLVPDYFEVQSIDNKRYLITWTDYLDDKTEHGVFFVNLDQAEIIVPSLPKDYNIVNGSLVEQSETETTFNFFDDSGEVASKIKVSGQCTNCYSGRYALVQVGNALYQVDGKNQSITKIAGVPANSHLAGQFDNLIILNKYENSTSSYSLIDLSNGKVLTTQNELSFTYGTESFIYPFVTSSYYVSKEVEPLSHEFNFTVTMDPLNIDANSIVTASNYYVYDPSQEGEFEGGDLMAGLLPAKPPVLGTGDFPVINVTPLNVTLETPLEPTELDRPLRVLNIGDRTTILIFK